jgi:hypothetical protein
MGRIVILLILMQSLIISQSFEWVKNDSLNQELNSFYQQTPVTLDANSQPVYARLVKFKVNYSLILFGDYAIRRIDNLGNTDLNIEITGNLSINEVAADRNSNIICIGSYLDTLILGSSVFIQPAFNIGYFIAKFDENGNYVWAKDGSQLSSAVNELTGLEIDPSNNILLSISHFPSDTEIIKLDADGNTVMSIEQSMVTMVSDIESDTFNNIWVTGFTSPHLVSFNGLDTIPPFSYNNYVVKYDQNGIAQWLVFVEDFTVQRYKLVTDDSGDAYLSGNVFAPTQFGNFFANGPQWVYAYFVAKLDGDGEFLWLQEIPPGNNMGDATIGSTNFLTCNDDGIVYLTGFFRGEVNFGNGVLVSQIGHYDVVILSYSSDGEIRWATIAGSNLFDIGGGVITDDEGNCYLTGTVGRNSVFGNLSFTGGRTNVYLAKVHDDQIVTGTSDPKNISPEVFYLEQNYPNPFNPTTTLRVHISEPGFVSLKVYNVLGKEVSVLLNEIKQTGIYEIEFKADELSSGIYFYRLESGNFTQTRKMILMK